jgi:hypothetical protein
LRQHPYVAAALTSANSSGLSASNLVLDMSDQADEPAMLPSDGVASGESVRPFKNSQDSAKTIETS